MTLADAETRQQIAERLDDTLVVEAAAGTGKTTVLVGRIVNIVRSGRARLRDIVAVTFTERAAGEMKLRLRARLEDARAAVSPTSDEWRRLVQALEELEVARISTLHGLCADLLREHPVEAGVDPLFEVITEDDARALMAEAFDRWFEDALAAPPEGVRRLLRRPPQGDDGTPREQLLGACMTLADHRDFDGAYTRPDYQRKAELARLFAQLESLATHWRQPDEGVRGGFADSLQEVVRFVDDVLHREKVVERDYDGLEAGLAALLDSLRFDWPPRRATLATGISVAELTAHAQATQSALNQLLQTTDADLAALLQHELQPVLVRYAEAKSRRAVLDFHDLLVETRQLVFAHAGVRHLLQQRFTHLFVDEFQDTDPLQAELLLLLAAADPAATDAFSAKPVPGKLFVVGDPKQSIYRFRRADLSLYERVKKHLLAHGASLLTLSASFRALPAIQAAVNAAFEYAWRTEAPGRPLHVPLERTRPPPTDQPSVIALPAPRSYGEYGRITKLAIESSVPDAVGAFLDFVISKSGWLVEEGGRRVPIEARHCAILFKRIRGWRGADLSQPYAQALEARGLKHVLVGGRSFHQREEVIALRTALTAVEWPDDELSVYATLKGPFFAFTDEALFVYKSALGSLNPLWQKPLAENHVELLTPVSEALAFLGSLHKERNRRPASATLHQLLEATRAHAGLAFWKSGAQALANVLRLAERAQRVERRATSFRDVIEALDDEARSKTTGEAGIVEEGTDGVRLLTVHTAKGLEYPLVVLAEPTAPAKRKYPSRWVDPARRLWAEPLAGCAPFELTQHAAEVLALDDEETLRLTYVAATRAKDILVVPTVADQRLPDTWTSVLYPSLYPTAEDAETLAAAPGCPAFTGECALDRQQTRPAGAPVPGLHVAETRSHRVVWWAPSSLTLDVEAVPGLDADEALKPAASDEGQAAYAQWRARREAVAVSASRPSVAVFTARDVAVPPHRPWPEQQTSAAGQPRPGGKRFGALVHEVLGAVPLDASPEVVQAHVAVEARRLFATDEERTAAVQAVTAALAHPLFGRARQADEVRREVSIMYTREDASIIEGSIDMAFLQNNVWWVVEFKTDASLEDRRDAYQAQLDAYVRAIGQATGKRTEGTLLSV
jgi:ATP-dependent helicase/nuclease subunit A